MSPGKGAISIHTILGQTFSLLARVCRRFHYPKMLLVLPQYKYLRYTSGCSPACTSGLGRLCKAAWAAGGCGTCCKLTSGETTGQWCTTLRKIVSTGIQAVGGPEFFSGHCDQAGHQQCRFYGAGSTVHDWCNGRSPEAPRNSIVQCTAHLSGIRPTQFS